MITSLLQQATCHLPEALDWLRRMVGINSFTSNAAGVDELGALTAACFEPLGFSAQPLESAHPDYGRHLFLHRPPTQLSSATQPIVLVTHLDTVFPPEEEILHEFHWREASEEGRIYGPGVVDNKGGTVLIWLMLRTMKDVLPELFERTHWIIAANAAEEVIGSDFADRTRELVPHGARAVLVFEGGPRVGGDYHLVTSRKGRAEYRISCTGRAAHAGSSHAEGINAVVELARVLPQAADLTDYAREVTVNIASIRGGTVLNRVPHEAAADLEIRAFDPGVMREVENGLLALAGLTPTGAAIAVQCLGHTPAWPGGPDTEALVRDWQAAAEGLGLRVVPVSRGGLSDANYLCDLGPTLDALGPFGGNAHCSESSADGSKVPEFVDPGSLVPKAALNVLALQRLLED
ncbi:MAG: M20/M25/M40 family metallo-hydrolase [Prosthecobacter sp.]|nr:M20/M25/M40 family metallo-hydrolase [Prosthecobacter sp.]